MAEPRQEGPRVGLFVTCLVNTMRPRVGFAALALLKAAGCRVEIPPAQTCCGQPVLHAGDREGAAALAQRNIALFEPYDAVVLPSGSCAKTVRIDYPELFPPGSEWRARAEALAAKTFELMSFLALVCRWRPSGVVLRQKATYHDSCAGLRELGVKAEPRALLAAVEGLELVEMEGAETCCGFGGTFAVQYGAISNAIVGEKAANVTASGAEVLLGGDLGCLLNIAGRLHREHSAVRVFHAAEVLAGMGTGPAIGEKE